MEDQSKSVNKQMPAQPKPEDQLQMHIETVTPDTEKDVVPTVQDEKREETDARSESEVVSKEQQRPETDGHAAEEDDKNQAPEVNNEETASSNEKKDGSPDESIETVSP